eukprot:COSAG01_NODE_1775_length_9260_cov_58.468784_6_plen_99_part_00
MRRSLLLLLLPPPSPPLSLSAPLPPPLRVCVVRGARCRAAVSGLLAHAEVLQPFCWCTAAFTLWGGAWPLLRRLRPLAVSVSCRAGGAAAALAHRASD